METQLNAIETWLTEAGQPRYRTAQIREAWFHVGSWEGVTTLSKEMRSELEKQFPWVSYSEARVLESPKDGTKKALLTLGDGNKIETVFMPNARGGRTVCVSSQVGCAMACTFCATGTMGLMRNLTADEIIDQVRFWTFTEKEPVTNIVYMGMGEPMANVSAVMHSARVFVDDMEIGPTRITISTVGVPAGLRKLATDETLPPVRVALSLHAGTDETRARLVPTHQGRSMKELADWVQAYLDKKGNRRHHVTLEYVMLLNQNDTPEEARGVVKWFGRFGATVKLNLIPWNHTNADMQSSSQEHLEAFAAITKAAGIPTTIRYSKGLDIDAACGQLAVKATT